jgi:hypothetical protein
VITVRGTGFGDGPADGGRLLAPGGVALETTMWTDTEITFQVPGGMAPGRSSLVVAVGFNESDPAPFAIGRIRSVTSTIEETLQISVDDKDVTCPAAITLMFVLAEPPDLPGLPPIARIASMYAQCTDRDHVVWEPTGTFDQKEFSLDYGRLHFAGSISRGNATIIGGWGGETLIFPIPG